MRNSEDKNYYNNTQNINDSQDEINSSNPYNGSTNENVSEGYTSTQNIDNRYPNDLKNNYVSTSMPINNAVNCPRCGRAIKPGTAFCGNCGTRIFSEKNKRVTVNKSSNVGKNTLITVLFIILVIAVAVIATLMVLFVANDNNSDKNAADTVSSAAVVQSDASSGNDSNSNSNSNSNANADNGSQQTTPPAAPPTSPTPQTPPPASNTTSVIKYNPNLDYKRMDNIHNSVPTNKDKARELENLIRNFDDACESYLNRGDSSIFYYLKPGTEAYKTQTDYKQRHPNLIQYYTNISIYDTRYGDGYYYVWVCEELNVTENGTNKNTLDNWVYKIATDYNGMYIYDYTRDPAGK